MLMLPLPDFPDGTGAPFAGGWAGAVFVTACFFLAAFLRRISP